MGGDAAAPATAPTTAPAADPKAGSTEQTIDAARKDFQTLRTPGAGLEPRDEVLRFEQSANSDTPPGRAPSASGRPGTGSGKSGSGADARGDAGAGNWLVRAMEQGTPSDSRGAKEGASIDSDRQATAADELVRLSGDRESRGPGENPEASRPADNPLTAFMSQWISPRDQGVLLPVSGAGAQGPGARSAPVTPVSENRLGEAIQGIGVQPLPSVSGLAALQDAPSSLAAEKAAPNPYLAALEAPQAAASLQATLLAPTAAGFLLGPDPHSALQPAAPPFSGTGTETKLGIPDFARPSDDDTYFKQLKKF
jgi:hypothetical protein